MIGGGASGIACAISAKRNNKNLRIAIFEAQQKIGRKILASGNGRCNITNMNIAPDKYCGSFSAEDILKKYPAEKLLGFFSSLGLVCTVEGNGLVYPLCKQASAVLDVMRMELERLNIEVICDCPINSVKKEREIFTLRAENMHYTANNVIFATGGKASPSLGGTGAGLDLLKNLGHKIITPLPCLCPVEVKSDFIKALKGIRAKGSVSLFDGERLIKTEQGEIQFTENALSGICVFNLTTALQKLNKPIIAINLMPDYSDKEIYGMLSKRKNILSNEPLERFFTGLFHKMIGNALFKSCGIKELSGKCRTLDGREIKMLCECIQAWKFEFRANQSFAKAQVMSGGVYGKEINNSTMESKIVKNLFVCGEALDICGDCGGFNLHFAFSSGLAAGESL